MKNILWIGLALAMSIPAVWGAPISRDPYLGAIVLDANTGNVLFEDAADRPGYPASMLKLMDLFVILDQVKQGRVRLEDPVQITKEVSAIGGSQVYLDPREHFTVEELLYALMVQSANDAAMALAIHVGGSRDGFVRMMNDKAKELGLSPVTQFYSPHGLPPGKGQRPDMTTPRDFAKLCRALLQAHPETLKYTSVTFRVFREKPLFEMRTHNHLLGAVAGCDGLKTGYFTDAGYSIAATAQRDGARVIAVVMGSLDRKGRDAKATELLARGLLDASRAPAPAVQAAAPAPAAAVPAVVADDEAQGEDLPEPSAEEPASEKGSGWLKNIGLILLGAFLAAVVGMAIQRRLLLSR
jgi:serine-type D-Ala-D-Ala carboxypeptidase (penicillin-binding protein 5/6)